MDTNLTTNKYEEYNQNLANVGTAIQKTGEIVQISAGEVAEVITACTPLVAALGGMFASCCKKTDKTVKPEFEITQTKTTDPQVVMTSSKVEDKSLSTRENVVVTYKK